MSNGSLFDKPHNLKVCNYCAIATNGPSRYQIVSVACNIAADALPYVAFLVANISLNHSMTAKLADSGFSMQLPRGKTVQYTQCCHIGHQR